MATTVPFQVQAGGSAVQRAVYCKSSYMAISRVEQGDGLGNEAKSKRTGIRGIKAGKEREEGLCVPDLPSVDAYPLFVFLFFFVVLILFLVVGFVR